jgi:ferredoxin
MRVIFDYNRCESNGIAWRSPSTFRASHRRLALRPWTSTRTRHRSQVQAGVSGCPRSAIRMQE